MKATIKLIELEGEPHELADIVRQIAGADADLTLEAPAAEPAPLPEPELPTTPPRAAASIAAPVAAEVVIDPDQEPLPLAAGGEPAWDVLPATIDSWEDIPTEYRFVNGDGMTVHIRPEPWLGNTLCPMSLSKVGVRRMHDRDQIPPAPKSAEVCGRCLRHLGIERKKRAA